MRAGGPAPGWRQLALDFRWDGSADLAAYVAGRNAEAVAAVTRAAAHPGPPLFLHGEAGTGKSHLLQAACTAAGAAGRSAVYVPLADRVDGPPELLEGLENVGLVALDDAGCLAGRADWQEALFHLFNRLRDAGGQLMVAARARPDALAFTLPDLVSRLRWGLVLRLRPLDDADREEALRRRAARRGLELPAETARYLLARYPRDIRHLFALLDELDAASLQAHRRLTIPFLKSVLEKGSTHPT